MRPVPQEAAVLRVAVQRATHGLKGLPEPAALGAHVHQAGHRLVQGHAGEVATPGTTRILVHDQARGWLMGTVALLAVMAGAALALPAVLVAGAVALDPILIAVTEDDIWIEIDRWVIS